MQQVTTRTDITLAVIAGGQGRRLGGPKVRLRIGEEPILAWLLAKLQWPGPTLLVTAPGIGDVPAAELFDAQAVDPTADQGPLRGLLTALEHATGDRVVAIPVDMPKLDREKLQWLADQLRPEMSGIMCRNVEGEIEPFPCVLRRTAAEIIRQRLASQRRSLHGLREEKGFEAIAVDWPAATWANINEPGDLPGEQWHGLPAVAPVIRHSSEAPKA